MPIDLPRPPEQPSFSGILDDMRQRLEQSRVVAASIAPPSDESPILLPTMPIPASIDPADLVPIWPVLCRLAIAAGLGPELRLWIVCLYISNQHSGRGWVTVREIIELTGWTRQTIDRLIDEGRGVFFGDVAGHGADRRVYVASQKKVRVRVRSQAVEAGVYDPDENDRLRWLLHIDQVVGNLGDFYAGCFAGWIGTHTGNEYRITWELLRSAWGRSRPQLLEWIDRAGIERIVNVGCIEIPPDMTYEEVYTSHFDDHGVRFQIGTHEGRRFAYFQRGNTYRTREQWRVVRARGKKYKIARLLNSPGVSGAETVINDPGLCTGHDGDIAASAGERSSNKDRYDRHNFTRVGGYNRAVKHQADYLYLLTGESRGGRIWAYDRPDRKRCER